MQDKREKRTLVILYLLGIYILFQVCWWGYSLVDAQRKISLLQENASGIEHHAPFRKKVWMIIGEGSVFLLLLGIGFSRIRKNISRELRLARMEKTFLLSVTHELKTPIAAIRLFLDTLRSRKLTEVQQQQILTDALKETTRLQGLSENILLATRLDNARSDVFNENIDFALMVRSETQRFIELSSNPERFELKIAEEINIMGDSYLLRSVIFNLTENALKYSPSNGKIGVHLQKKNNTVFYTISDEGPGIPAEEAMRVFDKFYRLGNEETRKHKGTGLGLYIVKNVVRLHLGRVSHTSNTPKGSIFTVELPIERNIS